MSLLKNFVTVGGSTTSSRILGFVRDMFMAAALGTGPVADAFLVAFRFPNLFRRLFAEGAFSSAFIPLFARKLEGEGVEEAKQFGSEALSALFAVLIALTVVALIAMVPLMYIMAPGFVSDPAKFDMTVLLTRIAFPYLTLISLLALYSGVLNARGHFMAAAMAPAFLNVVFVSALAYILLSHHENTAEAGILLSWATLVGGVLQLGVVMIAAWRDGMLLKLRWPRITPGVRRLTALAIPGLIAGGVTQINIVIGTMIASFAPGAIAILGYADRLYQLPLGIVGATIAVVMLPDLARHLRGGRDDLAHHTQNRSLEFAMALTLPAAIALFVLAKPIVQVIYQRGEFGPADTLATAHTLMAFAVGLPAFVLIKVFSPGFFAREDTKTPMWFAGVGVAVNIIGSIILFPSLTYVGIAIATTLSGWVNAFLLGLSLHRRGHFVFDAKVKRNLPMVLVAAAAMGMGVFLAAWWAEPFFADRRIILRAATMLSICMVGLALFALFCQLTGVVHFGAIIGKLRNRRR
ncbi:murein biosynthesis integral membrane protein MurJ [Kaistia dalseonensis]|uniref:Probable lipid II flippase MurJ n=1 Tax=Kaistia dalseonensis TaxID=410840 RepID=A0ABU0H593_9HYPH|nr:murein biosynthesis integral membrane protein MurJ [Kaistia dalseonensis]MCX5494895.1 murein biosynthesis integral membrane protein MurJ [Kaistia dalseonensis]MDQ0437476.1 putative peptidoglycan lipid II flippase [Kaistia dalseonensis]